MMKFKKIRNRIFFVCILTFIRLAAAQGTGAAAIAGPFVHLICELYRAFVLISGALATLVIVYAAIKWIAEGEDPAVRKNAKDMIKYALMALIIIIIADGIVYFVTGGEIEGDCAIIDTWAP